jgi:hypothetical protein
MTRRFQVPANCRELGLVLARDNWFPGLFIIGDSVSLFHKRTVVRIKEDPFKHVRDGTPSGGDRGKSD